MNIIYGWTRIQNFRVEKWLRIWDFVSRKLLFYWMNGVGALYTEYGDKKILYIKQTKHSGLKFEKKCNK